MFKFYFLKKLRVMDTIDDSTQGEREDLNYKDEIQG